MKKVSEMKPRKIDRRTIYTKNVIKDALLNALEEKPFEQITVTDVCRRAEVTRATYYIHYQSLTEVLDELLNDALQMADQDCQKQDDDALQIMSLLAGETADHLKEKESLLPVCHRVAQLPKYQVIFHDETISGYVVNRIYQCQRQRLAPVFMKELNLTKKEAEMLTLFIITGTYNVNKSLNWKKNSTWYQIHSMLLKFTSGGCDRLRKMYRQEETDS